MLSTLENQQFPSDLLISGKKDTITCLPATELTQVSSDLI